LGQVKQGVFAQAVLITFTVLSHLDNPQRK
jgi:hypothetical protein